MILQKPSCVILTALPVEIAAVLNHVSCVKEIVHGQGTVYRVGQFENWSIAIAEIGAGNSRASMEAERAISFFDPEKLLFVGIAGGVKDVKLGDVVVATKVYGYETGKIVGEFQPRPDVGETSYQLEQRAKAVSLNATWVLRVKDTINSVTQGLPPKSFVGPIAAGEKVIADHKAAVSKFLRKHYGDTLAVEMEGRGTLIAARANEGTQVTVIRGISDLLSGKSVSDSEGWQERASANAAAFAFEMLHSLLPGSTTVRSVSQSESEQQNKNNITQHLQDATTQTKKLSVVMSAAYANLYNLLSSAQLQWLKSEVTGYAEGPLNDPEFPSYRYVIGELVLMRPETKPEPISFATAEQRELLTKTPVQASVAQIEHAIESNNVLAVEYVAAVEDTVTKFIKESITEQTGNPLLAELKMSGGTIARIVDRMQLLGIMDSIRGRFIELLQDISKVTLENKPLDAVQALVHHNVVDILDKFRITPGLVNGQLVTLRVKLLGKSWPVTQQRCEALELPFGASVGRNIELIHPAGQLAASYELRELYASSNKCEWLMNQMEDSIVEVAVILTFAKEHYAPELPIAKWTVQALIDRWQGMSKKEERYLKVLVLE